jgi:hypothetical protein
VRVSRTERGLGGKGAASLTSRPLRAVVADAEARPSGSRRLSTRCDRFRSRETSPRWRMTESAWKRSQSRMLRRLHAPQIRSQTSPVTRRTQAVARSQPKTLSAPTPGTRCCKRSLQASGFRSDVTVFRLKARSRPNTGSEPAFRRKCGARVYTIEAAHNPEVAGAGLARRRGCP